MKKTLSVILFAMIGSAFAQDAASALADAQKAYVGGNWKVAAETYEKACPMQPKEKQPECLLWNVLALSQTGEAASFKKAGKRLDSLVQKVNPQEDIYADLMMTSAQFRLYLGKYDKAAEDLIHAIETSKPHHNVVLQKVCAAVKAKVHSENLVERCESLKNPPVEQPVQTAAAPVQEAQPVVASSASAQAPAQVAQAEQPKAEPAKVEPKAEPVKAASSSNVAAAPATVAAPASSAAPAPEVKPAATSSAQAAQAQPAAPKQVAPVAAAPTASKENAAPAQEYWVLQLGAFGVKDNATLLVSTLKKRKINAEIVEQLRGERTLYLVQSGRFPSREAAVDFGAKQLAPLKVEFQPLLKR